LSLDFAVLDADDRPIRSVELGVDLHHELLQAASAQGLRGFDRFADFYEDATVSVGELLAFQAQLGAIADREISPDLRQFVRELKDLVAFARAAGRELVTLAD